MENFTSKHSQFWQFNLGHLLTILGMAGAFLWWFVNYDRDNNASKMTTKTLVESVDKLSTHVESMDAHGTQASQAGIYRESEFSKATEKRVTTLESNFSLLSPKVERIDVNLDWVVNWIKEQKKQ
jgi:hypothetical protein